MASAAVENLSVHQFSTVSTAPRDTHKIEGAEQPDIEYHPNEEKWKARTERRLNENPSLPLQALPGGFPKKLESTLIWEGKDWTDELQWVYDLNAAELKEIDDAVHHFKGLNLPFGYISRETFPLPSLGDQLRKLSRELHYGRGFFVLRTIPVESYSREDNVLIYAGVSAYIANVRGLQDKNGGVLSHIKDLTRTVDNRAIGGPAYTTDKQVFHTDHHGDVISLFALEVAAEGGTSRISSAWRVYNELAEKRPDLIRTLAEPWPVDGFGGNPPYVKRPVLFYHENRAIIQYARRYFTGYMGLPRSTDIPPITEAQAEALDALHFLAERFSLGLNFQKGDIQYINNLSTFHARDGFRDDEKQSRHLLRLWLHDDEYSWKLPEALEKLWERTYSVPPADQTFPLEAVIRGPVQGKFTV
ncbi:hypothetical protein AN958_08120 [Leucoagaricus sp. SymC.cos]|nr:hypothetical protein AN958_08120 [Leucoagaricus sp. SymC.cos]